MPLRSKKFLVGSFVATLIAHSVPTGATRADRVAGETILRQAGYQLTEAAASNLKFEAQLRLILAVQDSVLKASPDSTGLPLDAPREPADLLAAKSGLCFDRSRVMEKLLNALGFNTRHVSVFKVEQSQSALSAVLDPTAKSHAVTEVLTEKGWMLIDSNARWIGIDSNRNPIDTAGIKKLSGSLVALANEGRDPINKIFQGPFTYVVGLYSRHGRFYWPYTPVPDYNLRQLLYNFG